MNYFRPVKGREHDVLTDAQINHVRAFIKAWNAAAAHYHKRCSDAEKRSDEQARVVLLEHATTFSETLNGLLRIRDRGASVGELVSEFSPLAMQLVFQHGLAVDLVSHFSIELCKQDPKTFAYANEEKPVTIVQSNDQIAAEDAMLRAAMNRARARRGMSHEETRT